MKLLSTVPANNGIGVYLDATIKLAFDTAMDASYSGSNLFQLYRSNDTYTEYYEHIGLNITIESSVVSLTPMVFLQPNNYYLLLVVGGTDGLMGIDSTLLDDNITLTFRTGDSITPGAVITTDIDIENKPYTDGSSVTDNRVFPSTDLFVQSGDVPISYITSVPSNQSMGVTSLNKLIFIYDSEVDQDIDPSLLTGKWSTLPIDPDPLTDKYIAATAVTVTGNKVAFTLPDTSTYLPSGTLNTEFTFTIPMYSIKGSKKTGYDTQEHRVKFSGKLEPVYATAEQIRKRLTGWGDQFNVPMSDYDIYKLIHEKSSILKYVYNVPVETTADLIRVNQSTICLVLRDIVGMSTLLNGNIKSRQILQDTIVYENVDPSDVLSQLSKCIEENTPEVTTLDGVQLAMAVSGIKSGAALQSLSGRDTKEQGISSRSFLEMLNYTDTNGMGLPNTD